MATSVATLGLHHVTVKHDVSDEPAETFFLDLSAATNATIIDARGKATIIDNDPPAITMDALRRLSCREREGRQGLRRVVPRCQPRT